jgi:uncharacterized membrane protein YjjB (DUF3815 family)
MIPGAFATKAILGFFLVATNDAAASNDILLSAIENTVRVALTVFALGTGLALPRLVLSMRSDL